VTYASLRARSAELRMREAYAALEAAELAGAPPTELERLECAFLQATMAYDAARTLSKRVTSTCEQKGGGAGSRVGARRVGKRGRFLEGRRFPADSGYCW
jgi:hypothetical protein